MTKVFSETPSEGFIKKEPQASNSLRIHWAQHLDEVRAAQRLRYRVFCDSMGVVLPTPLAGYDVDFYDDYCDHLLVLHEPTQEVVGTYRLLHPSKLSILGRSYCDHEFDLDSLHKLRPRIVELGRSCVHEEFRHGGVMMALWQGLADYMMRYDLVAMLGCASVPLDFAGMPKGVAAAILWRYLPAAYLDDARWPVFPRQPLNLEALVKNMPDVLPADWMSHIPSLVKGYLRLGTKILGAPALDESFACADFPMMMHMDNLHPRYRKHFFKS